MIGFIVWTMVVALFISSAFLTRIQQISYTSDLLNPLCEYDTKRTRPFKSTQCKHIFFFRMTACFAHCGAGWAHSYGYDYDSVSPKFQLILMQIIAGRDCFFLFHFQWVSYESAINDDWICINSELNLIIILIYCWWNLCHMVLIRHASKQIYKRIELDKIKIRDLR